MESIRERNEKHNDPTKYVVGPVAGHVISTGMRMSHTSAEDLDAINFDAKSGLPECINALEILQMRSQGWLSAEALDVPIMWVY
ncbi:uncharacterized protein PG998_004034 [Apiospora kogelbergensis]